MVAKGQLVNVNSIDVQLFKTFNPQPENKETPHDITNLFFSCINILYLDSIGRR